MNLDSPLMDILEKITDFVILALLLILFSIPIVTMGPAISATYYVVINKINNKDSYIFKSFIKSFKSSFKKALILDIIIKIVMSISIYNLYITLSIIELNTILAILIQSAQILVLLEVIFIGMYAFPLIAKVDNSLKGIIKLSFMLSHKHLLTTFLMLLLGILLTNSVYLVNNILFLLIAPMIYVLISSFALVKVLRKYNSEFAKQKKCK